MPSIIEILSLSKLHLAMKSLLQAPKIPQPIQSLNPPALSQRLQPSQIAQILSKETVILSGLEREELFQFWAWLSQAFWALLEWSMLSRRPIKDSILQDVRSLELVL